MKNYIAICDDEVTWRKQALDTVKLYEIKCKKDFEINLYKSAEDFLIKNQSTDILLLDIQMKDISGIDLKNKLSSKLSNEAIIFMTNYDSWIKEAFGRNVYGFLDKPIKEKDLFELFNQILLDQEIFTELEYSKNKFISTANIVFIKAIDKYIEIYTADGNVVTGYIGLGECEKRLPHNGFMRIHKSYIINFEYVESVGVHVKMINNKEIRIGMGKAKMVQEKYCSYAKMRAR